MRTNGQQLQHRTMMAGMDHLLDANRVDDFFGDQELVELARDETRVTLGSRGIDIACTGV